MDIWSAMWRDLTRRRYKTKMEGSYILGLLIYLSLERFYREQPIYRIDSCTGVMVVYY